MSDPITPETFEKHAQLLAELFEEVRIEEGTLGVAGGGEELALGAEAINELRKSRVRLGNPKDKLARLTPRLFEALNVPLDQFQRAQFDTHDFYYLSVIISLDANPAVAFTSLDCRLELGPKGSDEPIVQNLFPEGEWQPVLEWGGRLKLALDGTLNWLAGINAEQVEEVLGLSGAPTANIKSENELKAHIVVPDFSFKLGRATVSATGLGNSFGDWHIQKPTLQETQNLPVVCLFKVPKGTEEIELEGIVAAEASLQWLTAKLERVFSELSERFQRFLSGEQGPLLGQRGRWTLKLPRGEE